jgi:Bacteriocin-protection, YdeI or OmpD-Associated
VQRLGQPLAGEYRRADRVLEEFVHVPLGELGEVGPRVRQPSTMGPVSGQKVPGGVVHKLPADLRKALIANATALDAWKDITPLARNEFICWVEDAKQETTRERRIRRTQEELEEGQRRPCCWPGCKHRDRTGR